MLNKLKLALKLIEIQIVRNEYNILNLFILSIFYIYQPFLAFIYIVIIILWIINKIKLIIELINQKNSALYLCTPQYQNYTYLRKVKNIQTNSKIYIKKNSILQVINQDNEWFHVIYKNIHGWVLQNDLTPIQQRKFNKILKDIRIIDNQDEILQAYSLPNEQSEKLFQIINEENVLIKNIIQEWIEVQISTNQGWIKVSKKSRQMIEKQLKEKILNGQLQYQHFDPFQLINQNDQKSSNLCDICFDNKKNCLFMPCNHLSTCFDCGENIFAKIQPNCVICRQPIKKIIKIFVS